MFSSRMKFGVSMLLVAVIAGCSMTLKEHATGAAAAVEKTKAEVLKVVEQIDVTMRALNDLVGSPQANLKPQYEQFTAALDNLEKRAEETKKRAEEMRSKGAAYFEAWKEGSEKRIAPDLKAAYDRIAQESVKAKEAFTPFLNALVDIKGLLRLDLSAKGISSIEELVKKANAEAEKVKAALEASVAELDKAAKIISGSK